MTEKPTIEMTREEWFAWRAKHHPVPKAPPPPFHKGASLTAYRQVIRLVSKAVYRGGTSDPKGVEFFLPPDLAYAELGAKVRAALAASRFIAPGDPDWESVMNVSQTRESVRAWDRRMMEAAGVKTLKALRTGARYVGLDLRDGVVTIAPWEQHRGGGWTPLDRTLNITTLETAGDEDLGRAVREGLARSR